MIEKKEIKDIIQVAEFICISDDMVKLFEEFEQKTHELILQTHERLENEGVNYEMFQDYKLEIFHLLSEGNDVVSYYKKFRKYVENEINKRLEENR